MKITYTLGDGIDRNMEVADDSEIARMIRGDVDGYIVSVPVLPWPVAYRYGEPTEYFADGFIFDEHGKVKGYYDD